MQDQPLQLKLFELVKTRSDNHISYVDELASLLDISRDSVYRRLRGETDLSLDEALKICRKYGISMNEFFGEITNQFTFSARLVDSKKFNIKQWLESILENLTMLRTVPGEKLMINYTKDLPIFFYFNYPHLSAFKIYFWSRSLMNHPEFASQPFTTSLISRELIALGKRIWIEYCKVPSLEIWSDETIFITLKQIAYYAECGYFQDLSDALVMLDEFEQFLADSNEMMKLGMKPEGEKFDVFRNDIMIGDNSILFRFGSEQRISFVTVGMNIFQTSSPTLTGHLEKFYNNLIERAVMISSTGEKERNRFFNRNREYLKSIRKRIEFLK